VLIPVTTSANAIGAAKRAYQIRYARSFVIRAATLQIHDRSSMGEFMEGRFSESF